MTKKACIIGGGISGLVVAFLLKRKGFDVTLFEKSERIGGNVESVRIDSFLIEYAPNSLLRSPRLIDLIRELDLDAQVLAASTANKKRYVLQNGKLKSLPMSIAQAAMDGFFSWSAKLRLLKEPFVRSKSPENESVADFIERRLGREIVEKAADPFIAGIFAGDPERLSVKAAFPRLYNLEKEFGSLLAGSLRSKTEKADKNFPRTFSFENGVQTLTDKLTQNLGESIKTNTEVLSIDRTDAGKWFAKTDLAESVFDALIVSTPATVAAKLIDNIDPSLSEMLRSVYYPPIAMVFFGVKKDSIPGKLDGFGFLVPSSEKRKILGTIWNSSVFPERAPDGYHLLTSFVAGARNPEIFEKSDEEIFEIVYSELQDMVSLTERPSFRHIKRWPKAIPQYNLGYDKIETTIEHFENAHLGIFFCSNFYKGISVGDCVKNSYAVADKISGSLAG